MWLNYQLQSCVIDAEWVDELGDGYGEEDGGKDGDSGWDGEVKEAIGEGVE